MLDQLFESVFDDVYTYVKQNLTPKMEVLECNVITQVCILLLTPSTVKTKNSQSGYCCPVFKKTLNFKLLFRFLASHRNQFSSSAQTFLRLDCVQSLFCWRIRGTERKKLSEHAIRGASPPARDLPLEYLAFFPRILEQKRDCSQSILRHKCLMLTKQITRGLSISHDFVMLEQCFKGALSGRFLCDLVKTVQIFERYLFSNIKLLPEHGEENKLLSDFFCLEQPVIIFLAIIPKYKGRT